jgi:RNA polymerase sigma-70 factor, ECF subfamily
MATENGFGGRADPLRGELLTHCYRMLGSVHDAEDVVQETMLRAWRAFDRFDEERASLRTWLYRIATNACLTALHQRSRRPLPSGLAGPSDDPTTPLQARAGQVWLQPIPDTWLGDPADAAARRRSVRLALIAALQNLPPRQRAVLILREVLEWPAGEAAEILGTTTAAVNSALQRARAQLAAATPVEDEVVEVTDADQRDLLERYITAFEQADMVALKQLLRHDVELEMPPWATWFAGRHAAVTFLIDRAAHGREDWSLRPTRANGQPAVASYRRAPDGSFRAHSIQVLTLALPGAASPGTGTSAGPLIRWIVVFRDPLLFPTFGLPMVVPGPYDSGNEPAGARGTSVPG